MPRTVPGRSLYDTLACIISLASPWAANSSAQKLLAKKPLGSACGSIFTSMAPEIGSGSKCMSAPEEVVVDLAGARQVANLLQSRECAELVRFLGEFNALEARAQFFGSQASRPPAAKSRQPAGDLVEGYAVAAIVGRWLARTELTSWKHVGNDLGDFSDPVVLRILTDIEDLAIDCVGRRLECAANRGADILDVHHGAPGTAVAGHRDPLDGPGERAQIIDDDVESHSRRWTVGGRIAQESHAEVGARERLDVPLHHHLAFGVRRLRIDGALLV